MKKWMIALGVIIVLTILCIFLFIPSKIVISKITISNVTIGGEIRFLSSEDKWSAWWRDEHGKPHEKGKPFIYDGAVFKLELHENKAISIRITDQGMELNSLLSLATLASDSTISLWQCDISAGYNPVNRVIKYRKAVELKKKMAAVSKHFSDFVTKPKNIYSLDIHRTSTIDTLLLSVRFTTSSYPTTAEIYHHIVLLENDIKKQKASVTGFPMFHTDQTGNGTYESQIALPTDKWLQNDGIFFSRRMVKGYFMVSGITGGPYLIQQAEKEMENYISDYNKTTIAIPYQYLITDRSKEQDTAQWKTRLIVPVIE